MPVGAVFTVTGGSPVTSFLNPAIIGEIDLVGTSIRIGARTCPVFTNCCTYLAGGSGSCAPGLCIKNSSGTKCLTVYIRFLVGPIVATIDR